ncbi:MAG: Deoxyuridine 5'-triphosphate nucleotidohydrolase [uncultured bacterium]|nr:MAG: Deoxyuridine 5'-triphosphate nucleotidohydrolase [uncultured bacterium]
MDLYADETVVIAPQQRALVKTGIALAVPAGHVGLVWDKSGIATKTGVTTLAGVIDSGYRGELQIALFNTGNTPYDIQPGQKIAQLLIQPVQQITLQKTTQLPEADRGANGFGSTGV